MTPSPNVRRRSGSVAGLRTLLLHGLGGSANVWDQCVPHASDGLELWDVDLPWGTFGNSTWAIDGDACPIVAATVESLPPREQNRPVVDLIVAHSFSASVVLELYGRCAPGSVRGLVLVSPSVSPVPFDWSEVSKRVEQFPQVLEDSIAKSGRRLQPERQQALALKLRDLIGPLAWLRSLEYVLRNAALDLSKLTVPVLVIAGDADQAVPIADPQRLAARLPTATFTALTGCGHFPMVEQPDRFMAVIEEFARSLTAVSSPSTSLCAVGVNHQPMGRAVRQKEQVIE